MNRSISGLLIVLVILTVSLIPFTLPCNNGVTVKYHPELWLTDKDPFGYFVIIDPTTGEGRIVHEDDFKKEPSKWVIENKSTTNITITAVKSKYPLSVEKCKDYGHCYEVSRAVGMSDPATYFRTCKYCGHEQYGQKPPGINWKD